MIFDILAIFIVLLSFLDYKKAFFSFLFYKIVLVQNISIVSIPGVPLLTVDTALTLWFVLFYFIEGKKYKATDVVMPFKVPLILFCIVWMLSSIFSIAGFGSEITRYIQNVLDSIGIIFLMWKLIETKDDFQILFKGLTIILFITCIYGLVEFALQSNPLQQYEATLITDEERVINYAYDTTNRGYRISSVFSHATGAGLTWGLYIFTIIDLKIKRNLKLPWQSLSIFTAILCLICLILTKMRSPLIFLIISLFGVINLKSKKNYIFILLVSFICFIGFLFRNKLIVIDSLFDQSAANQVKGSSFQQRMGQFSSAFELIKNSPILGLGSKFQTANLDITQAFLVQQLLGLESIWLNDMVKYGLLGILADIVWLFYLVIRIPKYFKMIDAFWLSFAYMITISVTSTPGFQVYLLYLVIFFFIKSTNKYKDMNLRR